MAPRSPNDTDKDDPNPEVSLRRPVQDIVDRLAETARVETVTLGAVIEAFGRGSFLPMLMVPALLLVSPLSGIPLFSSFCGLVIVLVSAQMLWPGRDHVWLPARLMRQEISGARARDGIRHLDRIARWIDAHARDRLAFLVDNRPGRKVVALACLVSGAIIPFLELVPFSSSSLGLAVVLMATGLLTRDGLFAAAGLAVLVAAPLGLVLLFDGLV